MCVQGRERAKNWSQCVFLQNGWTPTDFLKDMPESLILKIHNIVGICASKFFVVNIENFSPITIFMNDETLRLSCVSVDLCWKLAFIILFHYGKFDSLELWRIHSIFPSFLFLLFNEFLSFLLFRSAVIKHKLLIVGLSSTIECLKLALSAAVYCPSYSIGTENVIRSPVYLLFGQLILNIGC